MVFRVVPTLTGLGLGFGFCCEEAAGAAARLTGQADSNDPCCELRAELPELTAVAS